ncbi:hypothetical protein [Sorangium sp. So ce693]|uniref:hypothetical protein n=1 Tax=Sorangium sp. So ce693 TaxID=3133318 RepID=UPI003F647A48
MNEDFLDLISALCAVDAKFLVIGAYAVGVHGRPRATKDLDIWVEASAPGRASARASVLVRPGRRDTFSRHGVTSSRSGCAVRDRP